MEQATARFEQALEQAHQASLAIGQDLGKAATVAYRDMTNALKTLRRNAERTNKQLLKDAEKLATAMTPGKASPKPARSSAASASRSRTTASASRSRATASKPRTTGSKRTTASKAASASKAPARSTTAARKSTAPRA